MRVWVAGAWLAAVFIAISCNQPDSNPHDVISLAVDTAPAPSVVAGDTMRIGDSTALGRLTAHAYNINQKPLSVPILWLTLDPLVVTTDTFGHVFAGIDSIPATPRVVAQAGGLQSLPFTLNIVPRPDSLARDTLADSAQHLTGFCGTRANVSFPFDVSLLHRSLFGDSTTPVPVGSYLVHWAITSPANLVGKQVGTVGHIDSLTAFIADQSANPSIIDTTKGGVSTRELIFGTAAFDTTVLKHGDTVSVTVTATARYQGRQLHNPVAITISFTNPRQCPP
jgi:hypothetical protein